MTMKTCGKKKKKDLQANNTGAKSIVCCPGVVLTDYLFVK